MKKISRIPFPLPTVANPSSVLYHALLRKLAKFGELEKTILVYRKMFMKSMYLDEETYTFVLKSYNDLGEVKIGKRINGHVVKLGLILLVVTAMKEIY